MTTYKVVFSPISYIMKVTLWVAQLQEITDLLLRFVSKHATLPVLENVYIKAWLDTVLFRATDMEKYLEVELEANPSDEGAITVNAKAFSDLLRTIEEKEVVMHIDPIKDVLTLSSASDEFVIKGISATEFVAVPTVQSDRSLELDTAIFTRGIAKVEYAVMEKNFSPVLTWVLLKTKQYDDGRKLLFVGTDSFRLAEYKVANISWVNTSYSIIIPKMHVGDIKKVAEYAQNHDVTTMKLQFSDNMVSCSFVVWTMKLQCTALLIQWMFPEYENENIMPTSFTAKAVIDKSQFDKSLKKISILTRDLNNYVLVKSKENVLELSSWETDIGQGETKVAAMIDGSMPSFGVNAKYVADFLRVAESTEIIMQVTATEKPIIFKDKDDEKFSYVVRPLIK